MHECSAALSSRPRARKSCVRSIPSTDPETSIVLICARWEICEGDETCRIDTPVIALIIWKAFEGAEEATTNVLGIVG